MAKKGQHKNDATDVRPKGSEVSKGHNNPDKSVKITTGSYKKPETAVKQAYEGKDPWAPGQHDKDAWRSDTRESPSIAGSTRARDSDLDSGRHGSDSNADRKSRGH